MISMPPLQALDEAFMRDRITKRNTTTVSVPCTLVTAPQTTGTTPERLVRGQYDLYVPRSFAVSEGDRLEVATAGIGDSPGETVAVSVKSAPPLAGYDTSRRLTVADLSYGTRL